MRIGTIIKSLRFADGAPAEHKLAGRLKIQLFVRGEVDHSLPKEERR